MTIAVDLGCKATKQKHNFCLSGFYFRVYLIMSSMENGDLELDGTFPDRYVSIPGIIDLLYGNV